MLFSYITSILFLVWSLVSFITYTIYETLLFRCCPCLSTHNQTTIKDNKKSNDLPRGKIAIVGSGIAGSGAAWTLTQSNFDVHIFESATVLGGNAKTYVWPDGKRTGLSVLAWPSDYFKNYQALLARLNISHSKVTLGFHIQNQLGENYVQGDMAHSQLHHKHKSSLAGWEWMVWFVRSVNRLFNCCPRRKSLYRINLFNPLNLMPLRWLSFLFGVTRECWDEIIVPMYASTFLTVKLDYVPSIILPIISDIIPLIEPAQLQSWNQNSTVVFEKMLKNVTVHLNTTVNDVQQNPTTSLWSINQKYHGFDRVIFASNAKNVRECSHILPTWLRLLFHNITYTMENDDSMIEGTIHSDASIFPTENVLTSSANFIRSRKDAKTGKLKYTNTFILSSWIPSLEGDREMPRLVTYGAAAAASKAKKGDGSGDENVLDQNKVYNHWNHPELNPVILGVQYLLRYVQGRNGIYFCGSLATPGNGHDLSFCSGMAVAVKIGAEYPFQDEGDACLEDFHLLRKLMGL